MKATLAPSEFINLQGIEYFKFEEDFMEENVRCIPMVVRYKMDLAGIKLKLGEWGRFRPQERIKLALMPINSRSETEHYRKHLVKLITKYTGNIATELAVDQSPEWNNLMELPQMLKEKSEELQMEISIGQWQRLSTLQRFTLLKLCRPGHENKNFPKAANEFGLIKT